MLGMFVETNMQSCLINNMTGTAASVLTESAAQMAQFVVREMIATSQGCAFLMQVLMGTMAWVL